MTGLWWWQPKFKGFMIFLSQCLLYPTYIQLFHKFIDCINNIHVLIFQLSHYFNCGCPTSSKVHNCSRFDWYAKTQDRKCRWALFLFSFIPLFHYLYGFKFKITFLTNFDSRFNPAGKIDNIFLQLADIDNANSLCAS